MVGADGTEDEDRFESTSNQARLRQRLEAGTLARRLADAYDPARSEAENRGALKRVVQDELDKVREGLAHDENQVD